MNYKEFKDLLEKEAKENNVCEKALYIYYLLESGVGYSFASPSVINCLLGTYAPELKFYELLERFYASLGGDLENIYSRFHELKKFVNIFIEPQEDPDDIKLFADVSSFFAYLKENEDRFLKARKHILSKHIVKECIEECESVKYDLQEKSLDDLLKDERYVNYDDYMTEHLTALLKEKRVYDDALKLYRELKASNPI
ncbi:hypothetical protein CQA49_06740 [Helicobacter sp. MIT 00-7814]|uniref:hypothetical protein n=1 Tax=unclassified Helicobacter TaxID=2593540 RepID=UPI000E1E4BAB|nr:MULTISPECIES: hypothetical protein [unclassified Helicobacter]RDU53340.1 hypothetical protein CQA49_06740 [Helicobacter sp. MIT 00-7814]RDU54161.1 hypothetical protein CQA37_05980 [Helicobacter sp. MIT 99-10781]